MLHAFKSSKTKNNFANSVAVLSKFYAFFSGRSIMKTRLFSPSKPENIQVKDSDIFHISAPIINFGYSLGPPRRVGSNEYPQSMVWSKIRKILYTPVNPSFTIIEHRQCL